LWAIPCTITLFFIGLDGALIVTSMTLAIVISLSISSISVFSFQTFAIAAPLIATNRWSDQALAIATGFLGICAFFAVRGAIKTWRTTDVSRPSQVLAEVTLGTPLPQRIADRPVINAHAADADLANTLSYFGFARSPCFFSVATTALLVIVGIGLAAKLLVLDHEQARLLLALVCATSVVLGYLQVAGKWTQVYACRSERALLSCAPGLPNLATQGAQMQRALWVYLLPRFVVPLAGAVAISALLRLPMSASFFVALLASAVIGAAALQNSVAHYACTGRQSYSSVWAACCFFFLMTLWFMSNGNSVLSAIYVAAAGWCLRACLRPNPDLALTLAAGSNEDCN
jgi:hypothetical protein